MRRITVDDLVGTIAREAEVSEDLARAGTLCIGVSVDHALSKLAKEGVSGEDTIKTSGAFLLPNLTIEKLITMVMGGGPFTRPQAERIVQAAQQHLVKTIKEGQVVEVENLGSFQVSPGTRDIGPESTLLFKPSGPQPIP